MASGSQIILPFLIAYIGGFIYFLVKDNTNDD